MTVTKKAALALPASTETAIVKAAPPASSGPTVEQLAAALAALQAENEALKAKRAAGNKLSLKVSEKGAVSVYGLGRFPVTLYSNQMTRLLDQAENIRTFMKDNAGRLTAKE